MMYYTLFNCLMIVVVTEAHNQQSSCVPIPALSNQPSWISWCKANCGNPPGSHPACKKSSGIHAKCTCGPSSCTFNNFIYVHHINCSPKENKHFTRDILSFFELQIIMCKLRIRSVVYPYNSSPINQAGFLGARRTVEIHPGPILHAMVKVLMSNANVDGHHVISYFSNDLNVIVNSRALIF